MVAFNRIKAGDILYDCRMQKMGNTTMSRMATWTVRVIEVDSVKQLALCSWNGNKPEWMGEYRISKFRWTPKEKK